jgi:RNase P/RNase MRP subunit POP5
MFAEDPNFGERQEDTTAIISCQRNREIAAILPLISEYYIGRAARVPVAVNGAVQAARVKELAALLH